MLKKILKELQRLNENLEFFKRKVEKNENACKKKGEASFGSHKSDFTGRNVRDFLRNGSQ